MGPCKGNFEGTEGHVENLFSLIKSNILHWTQLFY